MTPHESLISIEFLRSILRLNESTGELFWVRRSASLFKDGVQSAEHNCAIWNGRYADTKAFTTRSGAGYLHGSIGDKKYLAHRVVYAIHYGNWPIGTIDHIDGNKRNNVPANLRDVSHMDNMKNQRMRSNNTSGVMGVSFNKDRNNYESHITINGKKKCLGRFASLSEAAEARHAAELVNGYHGNHGRTT